jgi:hypothetical protein
MSSAPPTTAGTSRAILELFMAAMIPVLHEALSNIKTIPQETLDRRSDSLTRHLRLAKVASSSYRSSALASNSDSSPHRVSTSRKPLRVVAT